MNFLVEDLNKIDRFEKKITTICSFNNVKCNFIQGKILTLRGTNISFIEPHRIEIQIKNKKIILIYFDEKNLFLFNRTLPLSTKQIDTLIKEIKKAC